MIKKNSIIFYLVIEINIYVINLIGRDYNVYT